jgi:hypothetical protein
MKAIIVPEPFLSLTAGVPSVNAQKVHALDYLARIAQGLAGSGPDDGKPGIDPCPMFPVLQGERAPALAMGNETPSDCRK